MNNRRMFFIASVFLMTIVACVIPGLQPASVPTPALTTDNSITLSTMVAEKVSAAITLTAQAFPTPTLVLPTPAPTFTSTPTPLPASTLTLQGDGSTLFSDQGAGYEITVPTGWLAVGINKQEFLDAFTLAPNIQSYLLSVQDKDPNIFRLFAVDTQDGHFQDGFFTNINFIWDAKNASALKNDDGLSSGVAQLAKSTLEPEPPLTTLSNTANGLSIVLIESRSTMMDSSGKNIVIFQKQAIFNVRTGVIAITVSTVEGLKDTVFAAFDAMLETIKVSQ